MITKLYRFILSVFYSIFSRFNPPLPPFVLSFLNPRHPTYKQRTSHDCENVAIINALQLKDKESYENIDRALFRLRWLGWFQDPLYGNPWNVKAAVEQLGYKVERIDPEELTLNDHAILLIHWYSWQESHTRHILYQHWIGYEGGMFHMGNGEVISVRSLNRDKYDSKFGEWCYRITNKS